MHSRDQCDSECGSFKDTTVNRDGTPRIWDDADIPPVDSDNDSDNVRCDVCVCVRRVGMFGRCACTLVRRPVRLLSACACVRANCTRRSPRAYARLRFACVPSRACRHIVASSNPNAPVM
jgi:hypothetical protein